MTLNQTAALVLLSFVSAGCAPNYRPAKSPRIVNDGRGGYVRDGMRYSNLVDAVHGNPRAEAEAQTAKNFETAAFVVGLSGLGLELSGLTMIGVGAANHQSTVARIGLAVSLTGLVTSIAFYPLAAHSTPHRIDAINIYNDSVSTCPAVSPTTTTATLPRVPARRANEDSR